MQPISVTVHESDALEFATEESYYPFRTFEVLASQAVQTKDDHAVFLHATFHCMNNVDLEMQFFLEQGHIHTFQCFCADFIERYAAMDADEQASAQAAFDALADFKWTRH